MNYDGEGQRDAGVTVRERGGVGTPLSFGHLPQGGDLRFGSLPLDENAEYHDNTRFIEGQRAARVAVGEPGGVVRAGFQG